MGFKLNQINWPKESNVKVVTNEEFAEILKPYKEKGSPSPTIGDREFFMTHKKPYYLAMKNGRYLRLYTKEKGMYVRYSTDCYDNENNSEGNVGRNAIKALTHKFKERASMTFLQAFGTCERDIKLCTPKQFVYTNEEYIGKELNHISSIDGCSWYPSHMMEDLPTSKDMKIMDGTIKPTEEYPFAFYINSGHCAEYNRFDTHDWLNSKFKNYLFTDLQTNTLDPDKDQTILMKSSGYNLKDEFEYFYENRKVDETAKLVMNASIGMMHTRRYVDYKYAHLATIAIARANNDHLKMIEKIGEDNILHICVDGIIYIGYDKFGIDEKRLGIYNQEFFDCEGIIRGLNAYIFRKNDSIVKIKHGAYNRNIDGSDIDETKIKELKEIYEWVQYNPLKELMLS